MILTGLLALNFALRLFVALRPLGTIDGLTIPDDAYLSLTLARNIARGLGPMYGLEHTNGFQPLYVFLMAPVFLFQGDLVTPVRIALILLAAFDTLTLLLLYRIATRWCDSRLPPIVMGLAWATNPYIISTTLNGLETAIATFLIVASLWYFTTHLEADGEPKARDGLLLGALVGLAVFARVDCVLLPVSLATVLFIRWRSTRGRRTALIQPLFLLGLAAVVVNLPWILYFHHHAGDPYPVSGRAVRFLSLANVDQRPTLLNWYWPMLSMAIRTIAGRNSTYLGISAILFLVVLLRGRGGRELKERLQRLLPIGLFTALLVAAYAFYIFTPWFFDRYLYPAVVLFLLLLVVLLDTLMKSLRSRRVALAVCALVGVTLLTRQMGNRWFSDLLASRDTSHGGYMNLGLWAKGEFEEGAIVGGTQTGGLGYFADQLRIVNLDGVVNRSCYEALVEHRVMDYIRRSKIEYVVGWRNNLDFLERHSAGFTDHDWEWIRKIEGVRSWGEDWYLAKVRL